MGVWKYRAYAIGAGGSLQRGEVAGETAPAVRAALRRSGLQVVELAPLATASRGDDAAVRIPFARSWFHAHLRRRRRLPRAELYDGLVTMLEAGLPLVEALETQTRSLTGQRALRSVLVQVREDVRSGDSLGDAMERHPAWFHPVEVAMVISGQHAGNLTHVLRVLSERHERSGELMSKLIGALTYPAIVATVGLGVLIFLSTRTLPDLVLILEDSKVAVPPLTVRVMAVGGLLATSWQWLVLGTVTVTLGLVIGTRWAARRGDGPFVQRWRSLAGRLTPPVIRRVALARVAAGLAELIEAGVPLVESMRVLAPSITPRALRERLVRAADRVERGDELTQALDDGLWFDAEFRRLLEIGQSAGELDVLLARLAQRYERKSRRMIERLATVLEPAAVLSLAVLVAVVVMAAILPILKLQEIL